MTSIRSTVWKDIYEYMPLSFWFEIYQNYDNMQSKAEKEEHLDMIKNGQLDIIVGTHSLLGSRVVYNNLGLLVVDEEQVCFSILLQLSFFDEK